MIRVIYWKREETCAICKKEIAKYSAAMYDEHKSKEKRFVHLECWRGLQESRGIKLEKPPF